MKKRISNIANNLKLARERLFGSGVPPALFPNQPLPATDPEFQQALEQLVTLIEAADEIVALTGAGISTAAGIPDFRSPGGLWERYDPFEAFSLQGFQRNPHLLYEVGRDLYSAAASTQPTSTHQLLAQLEGLGKLSAVITQNIDGLHQRAGSREVYEVHGTLTTSSCMKCGTQYAMQQVEELIRQDSIPPHCPKCGGLIKPDVVLFGEMLPEPTFEKSISAASRADLLLVIGSSLQVAPASQLPFLTVENFGAVAILNLTPTPLDSLATLCLQYPLDQISGYLQHRMGRR